MLWKYIAVATLSSKHHTRLQPLPGGYHLASCWEWGQVPGPPLLSHEAAEVSCLLDKGLGSLFGRQGLSVSTADSLVPTWVSIGGPMSK